VFDLYVFCILVCVRANVLKTQKTFVSKPTQPVHLYHTQKTHILEKIWAVCQFRIDNLAQNQIRTDSYLIDKFPKV
jgi:hypothetical protein